MNSPVSGEFPAQRPVTRSFDSFFDICLNKRLSKQWWGWWFDTPMHHYDVTVMHSYDWPFTSRMSKGSTSIQHVSSPCISAPLYPHCESNTLVATIRIIETLRPVKTQIQATCTVTRVEGIAQQARHQGHTTCHSAVYRSQQHITKDLVHWHQYRGICRVQWEKLYVCIHARITI